MDEVRKNHDGLEQIYQRVREVLTEARGRAWQVVNSVMVAFYWEVSDALSSKKNNGGKHAPNTAGRS